MSELDYIRTNTKIKFESITSAQYNPLNKVERFLAIERMVYDAIQNGQNYPVTHLVFDKQAAIGYFKRKQPIFEKISIDGISVNCGTITYEHHFKPKYRVRLQPGKRRIAHRFKPLQPRAEIYRRLFRHLHSGGVLTKHTYWHILGVPRCKIMPYTIIEMIRDYILETGKKPTSDFALVDYSQSMSDIVETVAHLLDLQYTGVFNSRKLTCPEKPEATVIRILATQKEEEIKAALDKSPEDLVVCTNMKSKMMESILAHGKYSMIGIDMNGAKNYVYAKLRR